MDLILFVLPANVMQLSVFELLERGEVLEVPTDTPLDEKTAWLAFRDVILGMEYRKFLNCTSSVSQK